MTKRKLICSTAILSALTGSAFAEKDAGSMDQSAPTIIPDVTSDPNHSFLKALNKSGHRWVVLTNDVGEPLIVVDSDGFQFNFMDFNNL